MWRTFFLSWVVSQFFQLVSLEEENLCTFLKSFTSQILFIIMFLCLSALYTVPALEITWEDEALPKTKRWEGSIRKWVNQMSVEISTDEEEEDPSFPCWHHPFSLNSLLQLFYKVRRLHGTMRLKTMWKEKTYRNSKSKMKLVTPCSTEPGSPVVRCRVCSTTCSHAEDTQHDHVLECWSKCLLCFFLIHREKPLANRSHTSAEICPGGIRWRSQIVK